MKPYLEVASRAQRADPLKKLASATSDEAARAHASVLVLISGAPGLVVALVFFWLREPERRLNTANDPTLEGNGILDALRYVGRNAGIYDGFVSLVCVMTIIAYSQGFLAPTFERSFGWPPEKYAFINGTALLVIGPATVLLMGYFSDRWTQAGARNAPFRLMTFGFLIMVPTGTLAMLMPTAKSLMRSYA